VAAHRNKVATFREHAKYEKHDDGWSPTPGHISDRSAYQ